MISGTDTNEGVWKAEAHLLRRNTQDIQDFDHHLYDIIVKIMVEVLNILQRYRSGQLPDQLRC